MEHSGINYKTEEERLEAKKAYMKEYKAKYYKDNKDKFAEKAARYYQEHKVERSNYYKNTPYGRALYLISGYKREDKKYNRGECDLTAKWIVENIFTKPCAHCGKTGWDVIGCNRIDNSKPHTMDNVEPCCVECNWDEFGKTKSKKVYQYTLDGELVKTWKSTKECTKNGYIGSDIVKCCKGERKKHKGYRWSYKPL